MGSFFLVDYFWLILSISLFILEALIPGVFIIWIGMAALLVGLIQAFFPLSLAWQILLFSFFTPCFAVFGLYGYRILKKNKKNLEINEKILSLKGQTFILEAPIIDGKGYGVLGGTLWALRGPDVPKGTKVKIVKVENNCLFIEIIS